MKLGCQVSLNEAAYAAANVGSLCRAELNKSVDFMDVSRSVEVMVLNGLEEDKDENLAVGLEV